MPFTIQTDTSACRVLTGYDARLRDTWYYQNVTLQSGHIYGIVSEYGQGCAYFAYLLGGRIPPGDVQILRDQVPVSQRELSAVAWNLEPYGEPYGRKPVRRAITQALSHRPDAGSCAAIAEQFQLTPERYDRKFIHLSGERWRAAAAFGYAQGKQIFFAPYQTSAFYAQMLRSGLLKVLREIADAGALVILPVGSEAVMRYAADVILDLNPHFDVDSLC